MTNENEWLALEFDCYNASPDKDMYVLDILTTLMYYETGGYFQEASIGAEVTGDKGVLSWTGTKWEYLGGKLDG